MLAPGIQSVMSDVLDLACRVPIETLWPGDPNGGGRGARVRSRPKTYGEAYKTLLQDRDLLALGVHRPPTGRRRPSGNGRGGGGPAVRLWPSVVQGSDDVDASKRRGAAAADKRRRCPGGSRYVAINCPSAGFVLRDGDCLFVLRRPDKGVVGAEPVVGPVGARAITRAESPSGIALIGKGALEGLREVDDEWIGAGSLATTLDNGSCLSTVAAAAVSAEAEVGRVGVDDHSIVPSADGGLEAGERRADSDPNRHARDCAMSSQVEGAPRPSENPAQSSINSAGSLATALKGSHGQHNGAGQQPGDSATVA